MRCWTWGKYSTNFTRISCHVSFYGILPLKICTHWDDKLNTHPTLHTSRGNCSFVKRGPNFGIHNIGYAQSTHFGKWCAGWLKIWRLMQQHRVGPTRHLSETRASFYTWSTISQDIIDDDSNQWRTRLRTCVRAKGRHFEYLLHEKLNQLFSEPSTISWEKHAADIMFVTYRVILKQNKWTDVWN